LAEDARRYRFGPLERRGLVGSLRPLQVFVLAGAMTLGVVLMLDIHTAGQGYLSASVFGFGLGALLTLVPVVWADYFGRTHFGAIRSIALSAQVLAQAAGPLLSGALRDMTGDYQLALQTFTALAGFSVVAALTARQPRLHPAVG